MTAARHLSALILLAILALVAACGRDTIETGEAPGFEERDVSVDRSPFAMPGPRRDPGAPTTIAGAAPTLPLPDRVDPRVRPDSDPSTSTTTTTTTIPTAVNLPPPDEIDSICGMNESVNSLQLIWTDPSVDLQRVAEQVQSNMNRYLTVSPPELRDAVDGLRNTIIAMVERLRTAGWNTDDRGVRQLLQAIESQSPPFEQFVSGLTAVRFAESGLCPQ